jgi:hypothetical protein
VFIFESRARRTQRSTSDVNGIDPHIHKGTPNGLMSALRNIFRQPGDVTTVPEMLTSYHALSVGSRSCVGMLAASLSLRQPFFRTLRWRLWSSRNNSSRDELNRRNAALRFDF